MLAAFLPLQTAPLNNMKTQLEEVVIGQVASVLCVKSRMYSSAVCDYKLFPVLPILPYSPHSDAKVIGFDDLHLHYDYRFWWKGLAEEVQGATTRLKCLPYKLYGSQSLLIK